MSILDGIKEMFNKKHDAVDAVVTENVEGSELTDKVHEKFILEDGKEVEISAVEEGGTIEFILEDGSMDGAEPGEYKLEDGRVIVVEEKGVIAEVKEADEDEEPEDAAAPADEAMAKEEMTEIKNSIVYLAERLKKLETEKELVKAENSKLKTENEALKNAPVPAKKKIEFKKLANKTTVELKKSKYADIVAQYTK